MEVITNSPQETQKLASEIAGQLNPGDVLALTGELGSGKTTFVQGLASALGVEKKYYVNSPTFTILNVYHGGRITMYHVDWYRIGSEAEAADLGLEEYFDKDGVSVVEWAEKFPRLLPERSKWIRFEIVDEERRRITSNFKFQTFKLQNKSQ